MIPTIAQRDKFHPDLWPGLGSYSIGLRLRRRLVPLVEGDFLRRSNNNVRDEG
jgi:hypothetical protein